MGGRSCSVATDPATCSWPFARRSSLINKVKNLAHKHDAKKEDPKAGTVQSQSMGKAEAPTGDSGVTLMPMSGGEPAGSGAQPGGVNTVPAGVSEAEPAAVGG